VIRRALRFDVPARVAVFIVGAVALLAAVTIASAARERSDLPDAARGLLRATISAETLTSCLAGVQDDVYHPSGRATGTRAVVRNALNRLDTCNVARVERDVAAVHLPPAPPLIDAKRRKARAQIEQGVALLRAAALDARGARRAMREDIVAHPNGLAVTLAYRSANDASNQAFLLAYNTLGLLKQKRTLTP
jgi:hypothetical protein